jgi:hypothetical protein
MADEAIHAPPPRQRRTAQTPRPSYRVPARHALKTDSDDRFPKVRFYAPNEGRLVASDPQTVVFSQQLQLRYLVFA